MIHLPLFASRNLLFKSSLLLSCLEAMDTDCRILLYYMTVIPAGFPSSGREVCKLVRNYLILMVGIEIVLEGRYMEEL